MTIHLQYFWKNSMYPEAVIVIVDNLIKKCKNIQKNIIKNYLQNLYLY